MTNEHELESITAEELLDELARRLDAAEKRLNSPLTHLAAYDSATLVLALRLKQNVIYGQDNRIDAYSVSDSQLIADMDCVVAVVDQADIQPSPTPGQSILRTRPFGQVRQLCGNEPYRNQPVVGFASGFLVSPDVIATSGRLVTQANFSNLRFVFGFRMVNSNSARTTIANSEIYSAASLIGWESNPFGADYALVRLDRPVQNHRVAAIRTQGSVNDQAFLHVVGHPSGLPLKLAGGAQVSDNTNAAFFSANLDTYEGSEGSPVFNRDTHLVEGMFVRGVTDFELTAAGCYASIRQPGIGRQQCTRTTSFSQLLFPPGPPGPAGPPGPPGPPGPGAPTPESVQLFQVSLVVGQGANPPYVGEPYNDYHYSFPEARRVLGGWFTLQHDTVDGPPFATFSIGSSLEMAPGTDERDVPTIEGNTVIFRVRRYSDALGMMRVLISVLYVV